MKLLKKHGALLALFVVLLVLTFKFQNEILMFIKSVESFGMYAPFVYSLMYIVLSIIGFPATVLTVFAGTLFGLKVGLIVVVVSATIAAMIAFLIARYFSGLFDNIRSEYVKKMIAKINKGSEKNGFYMMTILRLSFLPYIPLSYAAGLVKKMKLYHFTLATLITNIFASFAFIYLGMSITEGLPFVILAIVLVVLIMNVPKLMKKVRQDG